jgi:glycosyltransferase involved in cell wall biosynthesis
MTDPVISVVLPVYNQADHIGAVLDEYRLELQKANLSFELLVVVNGKRKDDSLEICRALEAQHSCLRVLVIDQGGWGRGVRQGLALARGVVL